MWMDVLDSGPDPDTRSPTPPSSPRGSWGVATPSSSHGGEHDQTSEQGHSTMPGDVSDSKSIDSGGQAVVIV